MKKVVKFESKPKAEKKGFVVKTTIKAGKSSRRRNTYANEPKTQREKAEAGYYRH